MLIKIERPWLYCNSEVEGTVQEWFDFYRINPKKRRALLNNEGMRINDQLASVSDQICLEDELALRILEEKKETGVIKAKPCRILYADTFVLVASKEPGIIIHDDGNDSLTLDAQVSAWLKAHQMDQSFAHLHRLDRETSGCVLYSRCAFFQPFLDHQLYEKQIHREYFALCEGVIPWQHKTLEGAIGRDRHHAGKQRISKTGKPAVTHVEVLQRNPHKKTTLVRCVLETGRTHQIRVHLAAAGYPLLADSLYGRPSRWIARCALHAGSITWIDPISLQMKTVHDPLPKEFFNGLDETQGSPFDRKK